MGVIVASGLSMVQQAIDFGTGEMMMMMMMLGRETPCMELTLVASSSRHACIGPMGGRYYHAGSPRPDPGVGTAP